MVFSYYSVNEIADSIFNWQYFVFLNINFSFIKLLYKSNITLTIVTSKMLLDPVITLSSRICCVSAPFAVRCGHVLLSWLWRTPQIIGARKITMSACIHTHTHFFYLSLFFHQVSDILMYPSDLKGTASLVPSLHLSAPAHHLPSFSVYFVPLCLLLRLFTPREL